MLSHNLTLLLNMVMGILALVQILMLIFLKAKLTTDFRIYSSITWLLVVGLSAINFMIIYTKI